MADLTDQTTDVTLWSEDRTKAVTVITDGSTERLAVDANVSAAKWEIGEYLQLGYVYTLNATVNMTSSSADNPLILIKNPSGSGKTLYFYEFYFNVEVVNVGGKFEVYRDPTITSDGTTLASNNAYVGGGFGSSVANCYTLPTVSSNGTELLRYFVGQNNAGFIRTYFGIALAPNYNLLLTGNPFSNNRSASITVVWAEF